MSAREFYGMKLHEEIMVKTTAVHDTSVMRVAGGWIYRTWINGHTFVTQTFVPYYDEFNPNKEGKP